MVGPGLLEAKLHWVVEIRRLAYGTSTPMVQLGSPPLVEESIASIHDVDDCNGRDERTDEM